MKVFFINNADSTLADKKSAVLNSIKSEILLLPHVVETNSPESADFLLIQEKNSFKNFRYIDEILEDPLIAKYYNKVFTINDDDCATGILRGLYTSLPKSRFDSNLYAAVPFFEYPNELVFSHIQKNNQPYYLAGWRGNTKSNKVRGNMVQSLQRLPTFCLETTNSWLNHPDTEKLTYIDLILNAKFSLCPAGWAPVSFRIYESMALGKCPVIIADSFVPPIGPDWESFALFFPEKKIETLPTLLLAHEQSYERLGERAFEAWKNFFCPDVIRQYYAQALYSLLCTNPSLPKEAEMERWASWKFRWSNNWTIPQRLFNKVKNVAARV